MIVPDIGKVIYCFIKLIAIMIIVMIDQFVLKRIEVALHRCIVIGASSPVTQAKVAGHTETR